MELFFFINSDLFVFAFFINYENPCLCVMVSREYYIHNNSFVFFASAVAVLLQPSCVIDMDEELFVVL